jgi:hypothetical protein
MPVACKSVYRRILAHGGNGNPVFEPDAFDLQGIEQHNELFNIAL